MTFGVAQTDNQHVFGEPAFAAAQPTGNAQGETYFAEQGIAAVTAADRPNRIVLRKMTDKASLRIKIEGTMQTAIKVIGIAQHLKRALTHSGHETHAEHDIDTVGNLNSDFSVGRAD